VQEAKEMACEVDGRIRNLPVRNAANVRAVRREVSRELEGADPAFVMALARELVQSYGYRGVA